ncbi:UNVERIFIED_CONTAM: Retrovirus-related Pol polyprotein from transposon [Sesamum radiatum]|uniref:Retrovirus-related Pol polyprotein from transposon n=1 Tax=Sesamum radiatum TaxID=300843 RepID=A0AAW2Q260_SESRA
MHQLASSVGNACELKATSSDTSTEELSPALLGAIQQIVAAALREHAPIAAPPRLTPVPEANVPEEEVEEEAPVHVPPIGRRREVPLLGPQEVPPQWLARLEHLQKELQDVKYRIEGAPEDEQQGIPLTETFMADELPLNCRTPSIAEYDGQRNNGSTSYPWAPSGAFKNSVLSFCTNLPAVGSYGRRSSIFSPSRKEYLQRFNSAALEVPAATQEVKNSAFSQGFLDGDFFKSLAKKPVSKFDALLARASKYINMENTYVGKKPEVLVLIRREKGTKQRESETSSPEQHPTGGDKQASGSKGENTSVPRKGVIRMIAGRPLGRDSHQARKSQVREAHHAYMKEVLDVDTPLIQFGRAERSCPQATHNDALVITAILANYEVGRIFIDSGSSADILFGEAYDQMQLGDVSLEKVNTSLYGFAEVVMHPRGMVSLPLTMGKGTTRKTCLLKFLVVDVPSAYNVILGRPTLNTFQAVIFTYHMKIKFPTPGGVGEVQGDLLQSRRCYIEAVRKGQKRNVDDTPDKAPPNLEGIDPQVITHHLNIDPSCRPIKQKKRHFGPEKNRIIQAEVNRLMATGHIEEIQFPKWLSNVVLVPKLGGKVRMCIDFRDLNKACPKDFYPLPRIDQLVDSTSGCELLSMMDASQGYHQIILAPEDRKKVSFITSEGTFCYVAMPFGLKNAGATYQRLVYVNDMLVKSKKTEEHVKDLEETFSVLRKYKLKLNLTKCAYGVQGGRFLGFMVTQRGIKANPLKIRAIIDMKAPTCLNEVQRLTGRIAALSRFISKSAEKSLSFFKTLRKAKTFEWGYPLPTCLRRTKSLFSKASSVSKALARGDPIPIPISRSPGCQLRTYS